MRTSTRILLAAAGAAAASALAFAAPASADVTVTPTLVTVTNSNSIQQKVEPVQGQPARLAFTVTSTSGTAATTKVQVLLPVATPIAEVFPLSSPDWAPSLAYKSLAKPIQGVHGSQIDQVVTAITWTAAPGHALKPGASSVVEVEAGPMPATSQITLELAQTYSDGTVTRSTATVKLGPPDAQSGQGHNHGGAAAQDQAAGTSSGEGADPDSDGGAKLGLIISLLVIGLLAGAVAGGFALPRLRRGAAALTVRREELDAPAESDEPATTGPSR